MTIIILLIGISLTIAVVFLLIFYWSLKSGQFDDSYTPSVRMLFDGKASKPKHNTIRPQKPDKNQLSD